jgi:hypothetical protein
MIEGRIMLRDHHFAIVALMVLFLGCSDMGTQTPLDSSIDRKNVTYPINHTFPLELDLHADGGYQWDNTISDTTIVHLDSTNYRPKQGGQIVDGGLTVETFYFRTRKVGKCTVRLIEHRGWLPNVAPINTVEFTVSVYD